MTIRPHDNDFLLVCDCCNHGRPVGNAAGIDWACDRIGWQRIPAPTGENLRPIAGHLCPRCARLPAAPARQDPPTDRPLAEGERVAWRFADGGQEVELTGRVERMHGTRFAECAFGGCDVLIVVPTTVLERLSAEVIPLGVPAPGTGFRLLPDDGGRPAA